MREKALAMTSSSRAQGSISRHALGKGNEGGDVDYAHVDGCTGG
jgi:hypothetical protein